MCYQYRMSHRMRDIFGSSEFRIGDAPIWVRIPIKRVKCGECEYIREATWTPKDGCVLGEWGVNDDDAD